MHQILSIEEAFQQAERPDYSHVKNTNWEKTMLFCANDNWKNAAIDARIFLKNWPRTFDCRASYLSNGMAVVTTNLARDLPDCFSLALAPSFTPRPCCVVWRGKRAVEVIFFEDTSLSRRV